MSAQLEGKIAVITGGSSGIGLATARAFINEGAERIYVTGRRKPELEQAIATLGDRAVGIHGDVTKIADVEQLYDRIQKEGVHIDVLFANAGFAVPAPLGKLTEKHVDQLLNTNVKGVVWTVQGALPLLRSGSSVILSASIVASKGFANWSVYSATKAAVRSFARTWASDLKDRKIRVNAVSPGVIATPGHEVSGATQEQINGFFDLAAGMTPLSRTGRDSEVARVVTFLASNDSSFVNGSEIFVDGGLAQV
jgi:NAD(P)-dependent dehydrogenase (short-subunit alcohol dehydrogenase family)